MFFFVYDRPIGLPYKYRQKIKEKKSVHHTKRHKDCRTFRGKGSLIPHFSENNIQTKEEKSNKRKINTLIISLLMKYTYFVKIS